MGKLLKVLTVFILLLSIGALVMGIANFSKREVLIGRTHALETKIIQIAHTLEEKEPQYEGIASREERDIDDVTARPLDNPSRTDFWRSYDENLEETATTLNLDNEMSKEQLRTYYLIDKVTGEKIKDFQGKPRTEGEGTMDDLLKKVLRSAQDQYSRLNSTRTQLTNVRQELEVVISELNKQKQLRRGNLRTIVERDEKIGELEAEILRLNSEIARLEREKLELNDIIAGLNQKITEKDEEIVDLGAQVERLKNENDKLRLGTTGGGGTAVGPGGEGVVLTPGKKGQVISVNPEWAYVMIKLDDTAIREITSAEVFTPVEMHVYRDSPEGKTIVTRIRIKNPPTNEGIAIADNVYGWEQTPVQVGDDVVY